MSVRAEHRQSPGARRPRITLLPTTRLGWWAVGLAAAFFPFVLAVPRGAFLGFLCGLAGGIAAIVAVVQDQERAVIVLAALIPLAIPIAFVLAELVGG